MNEQGSRASFGRNIIANWSAFAFCAGVSFFLSPFVVKSLGKEGYGIWVLMGSLVGYLGLLDVGVRGALTRYVARYHAQNDPGECGRIATAGLLVFGAAGVLAMLLAGAMAASISLVFNLPEELIYTARIVILLGGVNVFLALIGGVFGGIVAGLQRFDIQSGIEIAVTAVRASAVVVALSVGHGLIALAVINVLCSLLAGSAMWWASRRLYSGLKLAPTLSLRPQIGALLSFGVFSSLIHVSGMLIYYSDSIVIAAFLPIGMVTFFAIAASLCEYSRQIVGAMSAIVTPRLSALKGKDHEAMTEAFRIAARIGTLVTAPIALTFWFRGESFINLWMGSDYGATSGEILRLLAFSVWLHGGRSVLVASLMGLNKHRLIWPGILLEALFNVLISIALVGPLGLIGVALGTVIPGVVITLLYLPKHLQDTMGIRMFDFFREAWVLPTVASIPFGLAVIWIETYLPAKNLAVFFMQIGVLLPLIPTCGIFLCFGRKDRREMVKKLGRLIGFAKGVGV